MNTARASLTGLSKPTVQTRKGSASLRATTSIGIFATLAMLNARSRARTPEEMMAAGMERVEARALALTKRTTKVRCMRT